MTDQPQPLDLDAIEARANNATPGPWEPRPHQHAASGCRCLGCHEDPTGWTIDHANTTFCDDAVAKLSAAGKTNDFGRELDSCDEGPFLTYADAEFAAHARTDVPALVAKIRRLTDELQQARQQTETLAGIVALHLHTSWHLPKRTAEEKTRAKYAAGEANALAAALHAAEINVFADHNPAAVSGA